MLRLNTFLFFYCLVSQLYSQSIQDTIITYDTLKHTKTVIQYDYSHPLYYNVAGVNLSSSFLLFKNENHVNSASYIYPEIFLNFSRNKTLFSISARYLQCDEKIKFSDRYSIIQENLKTITDTVSWYMQEVGSDTLYYYITQQKNIKEVDTSFVDSIYTYNQKLHFISIPIRLGYFVTKNYWRFNFGMAITPTCLINATNISSLYLCEQGVQYNISLEPTFETTYWVSDKLFFHSKIAYSRHLFPFKSGNKEDILLSSLSASLGFSYLFYDKLWE